MIRTAVVGFGFMGMTHSLNILKIKDFKLVAIVDINPDLIEKNLKEKTGNISTGDIDQIDLSDVHKYSSLVECLQNEEIDAVNISVHSNLHYEMTKKALLHDKHVFLEKPFCLDIREAEELISMAKQKNKILMVGHVVRFMPPYQKLKQWVDSKEFGRLKFLSFSRFCGLPGWGQWKEKNVTDLSGGALFDLVIHDIDFVQYILGTPSEITCSYLPGSISKYDYVSAMWRYKENDLHVKIEGGNTFHSAFPFQAGYMANFEKASILFTSLKGDVITISDDNSVKEVPAGDAGEGYFNEIVYFADCLKNNSQPEECMAE
jgi:predicted dehydrogenase